MSNSWHRLEGIGCFYGLSDSTLSQLLTYYMYPRHIQPILADIYTLTSYFINISFVTPPPVPSTNILYQFSRKTVTFPTGLLLIPGIWMQNGYASTHAHTYCMFCIQRCMLGKLMHSEKLKTKIFLVVRLWLKMIRWKTGWRSFVGSSQRTPQRVPPTLASVPAT